MGYQSTELFLNKEYMEKFFKEHLKKFFPEASKISSFKIEDHSEFEFKKSLKYELELVLKNNQKTTKVIRGNVPSYKTADEIERANLSLNYLYQQGFDRGTYRVCRPLGFWSDLRLFLYQEYPGTPFWDIITKEESGRVEEYVRGTAGWLAKFHNLGAQIGKIRTLEKEKKEVESFIEDYQNYRPEYYLKEAKQILKTIIEERERNYNPAEYILIHGDVGPKNIIIGEKKEIAFIDFGNSWRFNPFYDVANFLTQLDMLVWRKYNSRQFIDRLKDIFLKEYLKERKIVRPQDYKEVGLFQAWWIMQILAYTINVGTKRMRIVKKSIPRAKKYLKEYQK